VITRQSPPDQDQNERRREICYFTVRESAEYLNTSERFVRRLVSERRIAFHHVGRHVRIAVADLEAFVQAGRVEPVTESAVWCHLRGVG
jgi:excisionase family DNA binding protein